MEGPKEVVKYNYVQCYYVRMYVCIAVAVTLSELGVCVPGFLKLLLSGKSVCMNVCV